MKSLLRARVLRCAQLFAAPWTVAHQAPLSMRFPRQEYQSGSPFPSPGDLPKPKSLTSPSLASRFFTTGKPMKSLLHAQKSPGSQRLVGCKWGWWVSMWHKSLHAQDNSRGRATYRAASRTWLYWLSFRKWVFWWFLSKPIWDFWDYPVLINSEENQSGHSVLWDCILDHQNLVLVQNSKYSSFKYLIHLAGILKYNLSGMKRYYQDTNSFKQFPASSFSVLQSFWKAFAQENPPHLCSPSDSDMESQPRGVWWGCLLLSGATMLISVTSGSRFAQSSQDILFFLKRYQFNIGDVKAISQVPSLWKIWWLSEGAGCSLELTAVLEKLEFSGS